MPDETELQDHLLEHGRRIMRLWFLGALLCLIAGVIVAVAALVQDRGRRNDEFYDRDQLNERLTGAAGIAALGLPLIVMAFIGQGLRAATIRKGTFVTPEIDEDLLESLYQAVVVHGMFSIPGYLAPIRRVPLKIPDDNKDYWVGLFCNELPVRDEDGNCVALVSSMFGIKAVMLVCTRPKRDDTPAD